MDFYNHLIEKAKQDGIEKIVVGAVIQDSDEKILILRRPFNDFLGGLYEMPSGRVEENETLLDALKREIKEETNLDLSSILSYLDFFDYKSQSGKKSRQHNFAITVKSTDNIELTEHDKFKWQTIDETQNNPRISINTKHLLKIFAFNKNLSLTK
ncbi:MAG: NUDIX hydrolase [Firmicutes bacterium]|nr:NUDIX hydrolase [Bacillota bacterium]